MIFAYLSVFQITLSLVSLLTGLYLYASNIFYRVVVTTGTPIFGTIFIAYKFYKGPYSNAYKAIAQINSIVATKKRDLIGIYYDDPKRTQASKQRYIIGAVLNDSGLDVDEDSERELKRNGYTITSISRINNAVLAQYPCYTTLSIFLGVFLVYPKLKKFIKVKKDEFDLPTDWYFAKIVRFFFKKEKLCAYPFIEYYRNGMTHFVVPLCEQEKFLVEEYLTSVEQDSYYDEKKNNSKSK